MRSWREARITTEYMFTCLLYAGGGESGASYSLYVLGGNGMLVEHHLQPQKLLSAPDGEDAPIELTHYSKLCWRLMGSV